MHSLLNGGRIILSLALLTLRRDLGNAGSNQVCSRQTGSCKNCCHGGTGTCCSCLWLGYLPVSWAHYTGVKPVVTHSWQNLQSKTTKRQIFKIQTKPNQKEKNQTNQVFAVSGNYCQIKDSLLIRQRPSKFSHVTSIYIVLGVHKEGHWRSHVIHTLSWYWLCTHTQFILNVLILDDC